MRGALRGRTTTELLRDTVEWNRRGERAAIYSICSAERFVIEAGMVQAASDDTVLCIESTCNQVNQFGGYTGMSPADFRRFVGSVATDMDFDETHIVFGGDHLGPHVWRGEPAAHAMAKACALVHSCVLAGYTKIHLDASMSCADDSRGAGVRLDEHVVAARTAELCQAAEAAWAELPAGAPPPVYVIGTEVPKPGGERAGDAAAAVTGRRDVERTLTLARESFHAARLDAAWERVIALVVQPGVEFGEASVTPYDRTKAEALSASLGKHEGLVFEAHSTDYQPPEALRRLVEDHFAILKVGPALTFAMREAIFALESVERELLTGRTAATPSQMREILDKAMLDHPEHWRPYYQGDENELRLARAFGYSDRCRYYWPLPEVRDALGRLRRNLAEHPIPETLLSQYLPAQYRAVVSGAIHGGPEALIRHRILTVMEGYAVACGMR